MNNITSFDADMLPSTSEYCAANLENFSGFTSGRQNVLTSCFRHSDRTPSLSIHVDGRFHCFSCGAAGGDVLDLHQQIYGLSFSEAVSELMSGNYRTSRCSFPSSIAEDEAETLKRKVRCENIWDGASVLQRGDPVDLYFQRRGIKLNQFPDCLRFAANHAYHSQDGDLVGFFPTMIAAITNPNGQLLSLHQTYLTHDGQKAAVPKVRKLRYGLSTESGSIKMYGIRDGVIAIGEGIESCLSFHCLYGVPVWSAISTSGFKPSLLPAKLSTVVLLVDADNAGRQAAAGLATSLNGLGLSVLLSEPPLPSGWTGKFDWNNFLQTQGQLNHD